MGLIDLFQKTRETSMELKPQEEESAGKVVTCKGCGAELKAYAYGKNLYVYCCNNPVNAVDDREACSFLFPALVRRGNLSVGISTGGSSPTAAVWLKEQIEGLLPEHIEEILTWLEGQRPILKERLPHQRERAACFARLFAACLAVGRPLTEQERERELGEDTYG